MKVFLEWVGVFAALLMLFMGFGAIFGERTGEVRAQPPTFISCVWPHIATQGPQHAEATIHWTGVDNFMSGSVPSGCALTGHVHVSPARQSPPSPGACQRVMMAYPGGLVLLNEQPLFSYCHETHSGFGQ